MAGIPVYFKDYDLELWFRGEAERRGLSLSQYLLVLVIQERDRQAGTEEMGLGKVYAKLDQHVRQLDAVRDELLAEIRKRPYVAINTDNNVQTAEVEMQSGSTVNVDVSGLVGGFDD